MAMEQFTINGTISDFVNWVNDYGTMRRAFYLPHGLEIYSDGRRRLIHTINASDGAYLGEIQFHVYPDPDVIDLFTVTAESVDRRDPERDHAREYLQGIAVAIRKRWPQIEPTAEFPTSRIKAHADALERLRAKEHKIANFERWKKEYAVEKEVEPGFMETNGKEIYRGSVWRPFQDWEKLSGKT